MKKRDIKSRLRYWFDNWMSKGTAAMMLMLSILALMLVVIITLIIFLGGMSEDGGFFYTLWDVLSTTINAWMPSSEDGGPGYVALIAVSAIIGVFFTSFLIGIISSAVEDKLSQLREGNSKVVEEGHMVVLGFKPGEYTLLQQLILSVDDEKCRIVVAEDEEKEKMESLISENVDVPKNVKIICRNIDITDPVALECCSMEDSSLIVVNPIDDVRTIKILLAVSTVFMENGAEQPRIVTAANQDEYMIPHTIRGKYGFTMLRTNDAVARIIAHSCTQLGLSEAFSEVFNFEGNELHLEDIAFPENCKFKDILYTMEKGVPIGIYRDVETILNPHRNTEMEEGDKLIVLEENQGDVKLSETEYIDESDDEEGTYIVPPMKNEKILIIGSNDKLKVIVNGLPEYANQVVLAGIRHLEAKQEMCKKIRSDISYSIVREDVMDPYVLEGLVGDVDHIILLSDYTLDEEASDARNIMLLLNLRDIKERTKGTFTITSEMRRDDNRNLIYSGDSTEFIVSSNMASMVLSQVAVNAELYDTFHELLSNEGNEFQIKSATFIEKCIGVERNIAEIRRELIHKHFIFLGYIENKDGKTKTILNPDISQVVRLSPEDKLIVIGL